MKEKPYKKLMVKIEVLNSEAMVTEFYTNYYSKEGTKRIAKCAYWALSNGFTVVTKPASEENKID